MYPTTKGKRKLKTMKKILALTALCGTLLIPTHGKVALANSTVDLQVDTKVYTPSDSSLTSYVNDGGFTMVPLRFVSEGLGSTVAWDGNTNTAMIQKGETTIYVQVGNEYMVVNGSNVYMNTPAVNNNGNIFVPVRVIAENLGSYVDWNMFERKVYILSDKTNNFLTYGLQKKVDFPYTVEDNGIRYTLHDIHIYPVVSDEAKQYIDKFNLIKADKGTPVYFVWVHFTMTNIGDTFANSSHGVHDFEIISLGTSSISIPLNTAYHDTLNNGEYLFQWMLNPNESIESHQGFFINVQSIPFLKLETQTKDLGDLIVKNMK